LKGTEPDTWPDDADRRTSGLVRTGAVSRTFAHSQACPEQGAVRLLKATGASNILVAAAEGWDAWAECRSPGPRRATGETEPLWRIPAEVGTMRRALRVAFCLAVAGAIAFPSYVAAYSPDAKCQGFMVSQWTLEVDPGSFDEGVYTHWFMLTGPANEGPDVAYFGPGTFTVSNSVPVVNGNIPIYDGVTINPDQDGYFWAGFIWDMTGEYMGLGPHTMAQVHEQLAASAIYNSVTPGSGAGQPTEWTLMRGGPASSACANLFGMSWLRRTYPSD
jgi:hypothetical protein